MAQNQSNSTKYEAIIIGGGHNGLVAAAYLAKAGKKTLVLERRHLVGGATVTEAALLANRAAAIEVGKVGVATVTPEELLDHARNTHEGGGA